MKTLMTGLTLAALMGLTALASASNQANVAPSFSSQTTAAHIQLADDDSMSNQTDDGSDDASNSDDGNGDDSASSDQQSNDDSDDTDAGDED